MSESPAEVQELLIQEKPINEEKNPRERLQEAIKNPDLNADQVLDIFERDYIPNIDSFNPRDQDLRIMLFTDLPKKVISDSGFSEAIVDLPNASDSRLDDLPEGVRLHLEIDDRNEYGHAQFRKFPEDPKWKRMWEQINKFSQKALDIVNKDPELVKDYYGDGDTRIHSFKNDWGRRVDENYARWINEVKEKSSGKDLISSGEWLGHGTFLSNIEKMLENGGKIKSAYHVLNSGGNRQDIYGDIKGGDAHKAFIFFFHWRYEDFKHPIDVVGKYGTQVDGRATPTDASVFFPVDAVYKNGLTIGSYLGDKSTSEFFITKSPGLITEGKRLSNEEIAEYAKKDQTELPLDQAFFRITGAQKYEDMKALFTKFGYSEDWINNHIYFERPGAGRNEIRDWLKSRSYAKAEIPKIKPVQYAGDNSLWESVK